MNNAITKPTVSVVLCTYNNEETISMTIESILDQTYSYFEFIIWNDGSTDRTEEIVRSYKDHRIRYFYHENTGPGIASRMACKEARGKYIARIDGDDIALSERLEKEVDYMENHPQCVLVSSAVFYYSDEKVIGRSFPYTWNSVLKKALHHNSPFVHPSCLFRTQAYNQTIGYPSTRCFIDSIMFKRISHLGDVHNLSEPLLYYRVSSNSVSHSLGEYIHILRALDNLIVNEEQNNDELEAMFNKVYELAKKSNAEQSNHYFDTKWDRFFSVLSVIMPYSIAASIVSFIHNLMGCFLYTIK